MLVLAGFAATATAATTPVPLDISQIPSIYAQRGIAPNLIFMLDDSGSMQWEWLGNQGYIDYFTYGFPVGNSRPYGASSYSDVIPGFGDKNIYAAQFRNSFVNPNYYNPAITYTPRACPAAYPESAGSPPSYSPNVGGSCQWNPQLGLWLWPDAAPGTAYLSPENTGVGFRDLEVWNSSTNTNNNASGNGYAGSNSKYIYWRMYRPGSGGGAYRWWPGRYPVFNHSGSVIAYGFWPATYFTYDGPRSGPSQNTAVNGIGYYQRVQICPAASYTVNAPKPGGGTLSLTGCTQPPTLPGSIGSSNYYHTYTATSGSYTDPSGNPITCGSGTSACYVYVTGTGALVVRTYTQEMQNFANWYQYYRSHALMAKAAASQAFMSLPQGFRVDYSLLNNMAYGGTPQYSTVHTFKSSERDNFLQRLFQTPIPPQGTPSRLAVAGIGDWLSQSPNSSAPWGPSNAERAAQGGSGAPLSCRSNYLVFVTDGGWNAGDRGSIVAADPDGTNGPTITGPGGQSYTYSAAPPYNNYSNASQGPYSLANVGMYYWKRNLQPGMTNNVPTNSADAAFWQHLTTFAIGLGIVPSLVSNYQLLHPGVSTNAAQAAVFAQLKTGMAQWPTNNCWSWGCSGNEPQQVDDLWHLGVDGHGGFLSAKNPTQLANSLKATLQNIINRTGASSSLAVNTEKAGQTRTSQQVFQALFHPQNWWGDVVALPVFATPATTTSPGGLTLSAKATWSASCVLTGGSCPQMGPPTPTVSVETPASRNIVSWNGTAGVDFSAASLAPSALSQIGGTDVVNYLRGVRSEETGNGGTLRARTSVMGDVVDSSPTFVGAPDAQYSDTWSNVLYPNVSGLNPENGGPTYSAFKSSNVDRENMVYVGSNDGMLHGFEAGTTTDTSTNDGKEKLAYVPQAVYPNLKQYASGVYQHHYYVDGTPDAGDVYVGSSTGWQTWLVGGEGAGGQSIFALNITNPLSFSKSDVIGEWGPGNITCVNVTNCGNDLGNSFGTPVITRFNNGQWGFVFGNGLNSASGTASIFVGLIQPGGGVKFYEIPTGYGPGNDPTGANRPDGIAYVTPVDLNGDHTADYVYAGDYFGNVWRFNLTSYSDPANWNANYGGSGSATPLFTATNANGTAQPITTKPVVAAVPAANGFSRVMVEFGTGAAVTNAQQAPNISADGVQSLYGIWDWDFSAWNAGHPSSDPASTPAAYQYDALTTNPGTLTRANLTAQTITTEQTTITAQGGSVNNRVVSNTAVCWQGDPASTACTIGDNTHYGWYLDLVYNGNRQGEKVIYNPVLRSGVLIATTNIPTTASGLTCQALGTSGWTMALDPANGGRLQFEPFDTHGNGQFDQITVNGQLVNTSGIALGAVGSPSFLTYGNETYLVTNTSGGTATLAKINLGSGQVGVQLSWQELR